METSVVIPALNEEDNLEVCLLALKKQTIPPDEIIVVDNSSDDGTVRVACKFADKVYSMPRSCSISQLREAGVRKAEGDIILTTDADCIPPRRWVEKLTHPFRYEDVVGVSGGIRSLYGQRVEGFMAYLASKVYHGLGANSAFRKETFKQVGGYDVHRQQGEDVALFSRLRRVGRVVKVDCIMPTRLEGAKWGFLPVILTGIAGVIIGQNIKKEHPVLGEILTFGDIGLITGEVGHHLAPLAPDVNLHHDILALAGLGGTALLDSLEILPGQYRTPSYSFFSGLLIHHLATEGFTPISHFERYNLVTGKLEPGSRGGKHVFHNAVYHSSW